MRAALIVNPKAGRGEGRRLGPEIERLLGAGGLECTTFMSGGPGEVAGYAAKAARAGCDTVVVVGGDGSVNEAVNGIMLARRPARLAVVPVGTGNDFVEAAGIPSDWRAACARVLAGSVRTIDVGVCNGHYFANGIGAGFDAEVARDSRRVTWLRGDAVYYAALLRTLARGVRGPRVTIEDDEGVLDEAITLVEVANGPWCGGAFHIAPGASIDDGWLDVIVARAVGRAGVLRFAPRVVAGTHLRLPIVQHRRTRRVTITCAEGLCVHADGEIIDDDAYRLEIELLPRALDVLC
jgi:diacylglycerol kinase (ATP)